MRLTILCILQIQQLIVTSFATMSDANNALCRCFFGIASNGQRQNLTIHSDCNYVVYIVPSYFNFSIIQKLKYEGTS